jgi:centrosomal protein CEP164
MGAGHQAAEAGTTTPDGQIILEETIDENYEPTQDGAASAAWALHLGLRAPISHAHTTRTYAPQRPAEVHEYAQWLGMDLDKEAVRAVVARHLHWLSCRVRQPFCGPQMRAVAALDRKGGPESTAAKALEALVCASVPHLLFLLYRCTLQHKWYNRPPRSKTPQGDIYYFNFSTGESIWDHPCDKQYR